MSPPAGDFDRKSRFTEFYRRTYPSVLAYCLRRVDEATASDVAAEAFLVAWRRFDVARQRDLPWLYATAGNVLRNTARGRAGGFRLQARLAGVVHSVDGGDPAAGHGEREVVLAAVRSLPERDRELLLLTTWEQLDIASAARTVGCSVGAARGRLHRARRRLRARLADQLDEYSNGSPTAADAVPVPLATLTAASADPVRLDEVLGVVTVSRQEAGEQPTAATFDDAGRFLAITDALRDRRLDDAARTALLSRASELSGVMAESAARDPVGRPAVRYRQLTPDGIARECYVDPKTGQYLAEQWVVTGPAAGRAAGTVVMREVVEEVGVVSRIGERP